MSLPTGAVAETVQLVPADVAAQPGDVAVRLTVASGVVWPLSVIATDCVLGETNFTVRLAVPAVAAGTRIVNDNVPGGPAAGVGVATAPVGEPLRTAFGLEPPPPPHATRATPKAPAVLICARRRKRIFVLCHS
jgi:hypothetical protein